MTVDISTRDTNNRRLTHRTRQTTLSWTTYLDILRNAHGAPIDTRNTPGLRYAVYAFGTGQTIHYVDCGTADPSTLA